MPRAKFGQKKVGDQGPARRPQNFKVPKRERKMRSRRLQKEEKMVTGAFSISQKMTLLGEKGGEATLIQPLPASKSGVQGEGPRRIRNRRKEKLAKEKGTTL